MRFIKVIKVLSIFMKAFKNFWLNLIEIFQEYNYRESNNNQYLRIEYQCRENERNEVNFIII